MDSVAGVSRNIRSAAAKIWNRFLTKLRKFPAPRVFQQHRSNAAVLGSQPRLPLFLRKRTCRYRLERPLVRESRPCTLDWRSNVTIHCLTGGAYEGSEHIAGHMRRARKIMDLKVIDAINTNGETQTDNSAEVANIPGMTAAHACFIFPNPCFEQQSACQKLERLVARRVNDRSLPCLRPSFFVRFR